MRDGSDAVSDWPLLNALLNTAGGATWVSIHHGGGVGMGYSQHAGVVIVADGTDAAADGWRACWSTIPARASCAMRTRVTKRDRLCSPQRLKLPMAIEAVARDSNDH